MTIMNRLFIIHKTFTGNINSRDKFVVQGEKTLKG